jgi:DNA (cytosine-5)-methyltransferase 1
VDVDPDACATAESAGHERWNLDVTTLDPSEFTADYGDIEGLIASPPCQDDSQSNRRGKRGVSHLIAEPRRWISELLPDWIALEQVPTVLPFWQEYSHWLRSIGYSAWVGLLCADRYGVGQSRTRAVLIASRTRGVSAPAVTHGDTARDLFGEGLQSIVPGADALGWDLENVRAHVWRGPPGSGDWLMSRPATTVTGTNRIPPPGYRKPGELQFGPGTIRLDVSDMAALQTFPRDYPWSGTITSQRQQIGNAVPPRLAAHVLAALGVGRLRVAA